MTKHKRRQAESGRKKSADERGRLIRDFRKVYDVTLEDMAKRVGLSQPMLTRFETGTRNLSADAWARLLIAMREIGKEKGEAERKRQVEVATSALFSEVWATLRPSLAPSIPKVVDHPVYGGAVSVSPAEAEEMQKEVLQLLERNTHSRIHEHINPLVTQLNYWKERAQSQSQVIAVQAGRIADLERELSRERANKASGGVMVTPDVARKKKK